MTVLITSISYEKQFLFMNHKIEQTENIHKVLDLDGHSLNAHCCNFCERTCTLRNATS